jgi:putative intracellular protease/amidase/YHS domain-containing protein
MALKALAITGLAAALAPATNATEDGSQKDGVQKETPASSAAVRPLPVPQGGKPIPVAVLISPGAVVIDFAGPWGVFESVDLGVSMFGGSPFQLFTVAESTAPIKVSGGLQVVADYTYANAPQPKVIVIPAQDDPSPATLDWVRKASKGADLTMSVCTGAYLLAKTGLLSGKEATTHHNALTALAADYPDITVKRGARFVDAGAVSSAGGLSAGIDLALHVVERYYGRSIAERTAYALEYQGQGWKDPSSNSVYAKRPVITGAHPRCPVCEYEMSEAELKTAPTEVYKSKTYYFCSPEDKARFNKAQEKFAEQ